jgi:hypothetical protein
MTISVPCSCTDSVGRCLTEAQARISSLDARCICAGSLSVSGCATLACSVTDAASVTSLTAASILGDPSIPRASLGDSSYSSNASAVQLNGQQLQATVFSTPGLVPLSLANGSTLLMGLPLVSGVPSFVLPWNCNLGTFFHFFNTGTGSALIGISAAGTINSPAGTAATLTVAPQQRGVIFKFAPTQWAAIVQ